jgi:predicted SnoaL-like aldol condensation-catalyzing enzyme
VAVCLDLAATLLGLCSGHDGAPADGKPVHWDAVDIYRVTDGKISEEWAVAAGAATAQIGAFNPPWAA